MPRTGSSVVKLASVDPGMTTGLVVVSIVVGVEYINVDRAKIVQTTDVSEVAAIILGSSNLRNVVMERIPFHPSKEGSDPWNKLHLMLQMNGYMDVRGIDYENTHGRCIYMIGPSQWKPFMRSRMGEKEFKTTELPVPHAKDAAAMLHYFIQMNHPEKRIYYA